MRSDTILICHSNLGTKHKSHQILITIRHENGVIVLQNEYPLCIFTQIMSNTIQWSFCKHEWQSNSNFQGGHLNLMSDSSLTECKPQSTLKLTTDKTLIDSTEP